MLACKRFNYWRFRAVTFAIIVSVGLTLFCMLKLELRERNGDFDPREKYGRTYNVFDATSLRNNVCKKQYVHHTQFKDFNDRSEFDKKITSHDEVTKNKKQKNVCTKLNDCFNFDRCTSSFYIYLYPFTNNQFISVMYGQILEAISSNSMYITSDPNKACLFILSLDTLDRDKLSSNFVKDLHKKVSQSSYWNNGENHLIINMFSGTWPDYSDDLSFDYGKAMIAKSSMSLQSLRYNYDISIPLLPKNFPLRNNKTNINKNATLYPIRRKYLLAFKGKRYLYGIGSESRNSLHLIDNGDDIILLTSCRHGKDWEKLKDDRCDGDNERYDRYDYVDLLSNSTFCLIPRGRRLSSFRLIEAIQYGCIPISLSNGYALPFSEVIDWSKFTINIDERLILQIPSILRSITDEEILSRRQQTLFVWEKYFSSIQVVVSTMIELIRERIQPNLKRNYLLWNAFPGGLTVDPQFSPSPLHYPFYVSTLHSRPIHKFTAVIVAVSPVYRASAPLFKLIKTINLSDLVDQILVVWLPGVGIPDKSKWPRTKVTLRVIHPPKKDMNAKYNYMGLVKTDAVFTFREGITINTEEIEFAFSVWVKNPSQMVGFSTGLHYSINGAQGIEWKFTSNLMNEFSTIRTSAVVFHRYYSYYYTVLSPPHMHELVERERTCESLAMNFVVSHLSSKPPIKVARSNQFKDSFNRMTTSDDVESRCLAELIRIFRYLPLTKSKLSFNPILFRDPVSTLRKRYRTIG